MGKHDITEEKNINRKKGKKKKRHIIRKIFILLLLLIAIAGIIFAKKVKDLDGNWIAVLLGHNKETLENLETLELLILGESTGSSDTIIVCSYNPRTQKASMLSIPRDTFTGSNTNSARPSHKINSLYSNGETPEKTLEAVNEITGLNIEKYVLVDTKALVELVDLIGGIEFNVPIDMKYDDYSQDLHIDLKEGLQNLNGEKVEQVVRFRHNNDGSTYPSEYGIEDYGRMRTQRDVIKTIAKQTIQFKNVKEIGNILDLVEKYVKTNIKFSELKDYIPYAVNINMDTIQTEQLPGESKILKGIWFFLNDEEETEQIVNTLFSE